MINPHKKIMLLRAMITFIVMFLMEFFWSKHSLIESLLTSLIFVVVVYLILVVIFHLTKKRA